MRQVSLCWDELPDEVRRYFETRQIGPGQRVYFLKLTPLPDSTLARAVGQHGWQHAEQPHVVQALASRFSRGRRTIRRRLKLLPNTIRTATESTEPFDGNVEPS